MEFYFLIFIRLNSGQQYRLEHGDALCTDDVAYQRFKKLFAILSVAFLKNTAQF
jgi:UDP-2,3-diacylglucosamine hydrolase